MARYDIHADSTYGEVTTTDNLTNKAIYDFNLHERIEGLDNDNFCYGEIPIPAHFLSSNALSNGIRVRIPYRPIYKTLIVRFRIDHSSGEVEHFPNNSDHTNWFKVHSEAQTGETLPICLSQYPGLNENGIYNFVMRSGYIAIYSGDETDFQFKPALKQNEVFLLKAFAGNIYQFPTTGVGLIDFLHGNFENSGLATKLQSEFENDKMIVNNAYMNSETGELLLDVTERNG